MLKILEEVIAQRLMLRGSKQINKSDFEIQLSSTLMSKVVDDINKGLPKDKQISQNANSNQFTYSMFDHKWLIINRSYRDNTNSEDVEEVLYALAMK